MSMADNKQKVVEDASVTPAAATIQTKSAIMSGLLATVSAMSHEELMQFWPDAMTLAAGVSNAAAAQNQASIQMKPTDATGGMVKEETKALFEGESLSEDAQLKISTLIENAVSVQIAIITEELEETYRSNLVEEAAKIQEELVGKIDSYATYAAEQWVEKNEIALESTIRVERANRLIEGITSLIAQCGLTLSEESVTAFEALESNRTELETKLSESVSENEDLRQRLAVSNAVLIFNESSAGLTTLETEKFKKLVEDIDVEIDAEALRKKLTIIREANFKASTKRSNTGLTEANDAITPEELLNEEKVVVEAPTDPRIARYAEAISRSTDRYSRGPYTNQR